MKWYLPISLIALALFALIFGHFILAPKTGNRLSGWSGADPEIPVRIVRAKKLQRPRAIQIGGELQPLKEIDIASQLPGIVREIRYQLGDRVTAGAVVAIIESKELLERLHTQEQAIKAARDDLRAKETQLTSAEKELATARELHTRELIARRDVEQAEIELNTARAQKDLSQAQLTQSESVLKQSRYLLSLTRLIAPSAGVVTRRWVEPRAAVAASMKILSVADTDTMRLVIRLPSANAADLHPGMTLRVRLDDFPGREFEGKLAHSDALSETGKAAMVEIRLSNNEGLMKTGMKAALSLPVNGTEEVILLPHEALFELRGKNYVYTVAAGKARQNAVSKGGEQNGNAVITSGLTEGESVIVAGVERLRADSRVRVVE
jgi:RND family efflux transporter MFP subunit